MFARPRTVVEGQHDFFVGQKIKLLEMLETKTRSARGVDFDHAAEAKRVRIGADGLDRLRCNGRLFRDRPGNFNVAGHAGFSGRGGRKLRGRCGSDDLGSEFMARMGGPDQTPAMTTAATTLANIKPTALRMVTLP